MPGTDDGTRPSGRFIEPGCQLCVIDGKVELPTAVGVAQDGDPRAVALQETDVLGDVDGLDLSAKAAGDGRDGVAEFAIRPRVQ